MAIEKLTADIPLPNRSGVIDPRLQTRAAQLDRQRAQSGREPVTPPAPTSATRARGAVKQAITNFRTFVGRR